MLDDGTCTYGYPDLLPENVLAWELWLDIGLLGWDTAEGLRDVDLTPCERGDLLMKIRALSSEAAKIAKEKAKSKEGL